MRVSNPRSASPAVTFLSPAASLLDSTPALVTSKGDHGGRGSAGKETKGLPRTSTLIASRSTISLTPRVTFKTSSAANATPFASSPLVADKTRERDFGRRRPQGRTAHGVGKGETRKAGGGHGLFGGDSSPRPVDSSPPCVPVSLATAEPTAKAPSGTTTTVVASTGDNGHGSKEGAPDATAAAIAPTAANGRTGGVGSPGPVKSPPRVPVSPATAEPTAKAPAGETTTVVASTGDNDDGSTESAPDAAAAAVASIAANSRSDPSDTTATRGTNDTRRKSAVRFLVSGDSPTKSPVSTPQEDRTSDEPKITASPPGMNASLTAVGDIVSWVDSGARIGSQPREATVTKSAGEEIPSATVHSQPANSSQGKRESPEVQLPEVCRSDQDTAGSAVKPTEGKVCTPGIMDEDETPSTQQDTMVRAAKMS